MGTGCCCIQKLGHSIDFRSLNWQDMNGSFWFIVLLTFFIWVFHASFDNILRNLKVDWIFSTLAGITFYRISNYNLRKKMEHSEIMTLSFIIWRKKAWKLARCVLNYQKWQSCNEHFAKKPINIFYGCLILQILKRSKTLFCTFAGSDSYFDRGKFGHH